MKLSKTVQLFGCLCKDFYSFEAVQRFHLEIIIIFIMFTPTQLLRGQVLLNNRNSNF